MAERSLSAEPLLLSVKEFAPLLNIGLSTAWSLVRSGELPALKIGSKVFVPRQAIEAFANRAVPAQGGVYGVEIRTKDIDSSAPSGFAGRRPGARATGQSGTKSVATTHPSRKP